MKTPVLKKQKPYTLPHGGVLPGWVQAREVKKAVSKAREEPRKLSTSHTVAGEKISCHLLSFKGDIVRAKHVAPTDDMDIDPILLKEGHPSTTLAAGSRSRTTSQVGVDVNTL